MNKYAKPKKAIRGSVVKGPESVKKLAEEKGVRIMIKAKIVRDESSKLVKKSRRVKVVELGSVFPTLWIRGADGGVRLLDVAAPKAPERQPSNNTLEIEYIKQQTSLISAPRRTSISKAVRAADLTDILDSIIPMKEAPKEADVALVKISEEDAREEKRLQDILFDIETKRLEVVKRHELVNALERRKVASRERENARRRKSRYKTISSSTYMYHELQDGLMVPPYKLNIRRAVLFGPFEGNVDAVTRSVAQIVYSRGPHQIIFPSLDRKYKVF